MARSTRTSGTRRGAAWVVALALIAGASPAAQAEVAGDPRDRPYVSIVLNQALETERTRVDIPWTNPETGTKGVLTIDRTWFKDAGTPCRDYTRTIERAGGSRSTVRGTGCRIGPAVWSVTETEEGKAPPAAAGSPRRLEPPASATPPPPPTASAPPETARAAPPPPPPEPPHAASTPPAADAGPTSSGAASAGASPPETTSPESFPPETPSAAAPAMPDFTQPTKAEM